MAIKLINNDGFQWSATNGVNFKGYGFFKGTILEDHYHKIFTDWETKDEFADILQTCNGCFSVIIEKEEYIFAAVDRLRSIPLFYTLHDGKFIISDNARYVREHIDDDKINEISNIEFRMTGYVTGNDTLYLKVKQLQAGEYLIVNKKDLSIETKNYYNYRHSRFFEKEMNQLIEELDQVHLNVFKRLIDSLNGKTIMLPLSGGEDSRLIAVMLRRLGYQKVICYTYGKLGNKEATISKKVADYLGYDWVFIPYSRNRWRRWYGSQEMKDYFLYADGLSSLPHFQDWPAVKEVLDGISPKDDLVFIPGHSGDFVAGSHVPPWFICSDKISKEQLLSDIYKRHYNMWRASSNSQISELKNKIKSNINIKPYYTAEEAADEFEWV